LGTNLLWPLSLSTVCQVSSSAHRPSRGWDLEGVLSLYHQSLSTLMDQARAVHVGHFTQDEIQISALLSIKTGSCPENCSYCPQSAHYATGITKQPLMDSEEVVQQAKAAKENGVTRFCLGAAWRGPNDRDLEKVADMIKKIKEMGMETCATLGLLKHHQAQTLKDAGLDFYNHNIDSSEDFYAQIITTRTFDQRLETLSHLRACGIKVCCGGILGMGETVEQRLKMLLTLAQMDPQPESVPMNQLIAIPGTPLENQERVDPFDFIKTIAVARIMMPHSYIRLSAGREHMSDEMQHLCFYVGANSIFYGQKLLTAKNPIPQKDQDLFKRLGLKAASMDGSTKYTLKKNALHPQ
jgi:biotin synthase